MLAGGEHTRPYSDPMYVQGRFGSAPVKGWSCGGDTADVLGLFARTMVGSSRGNLEKQEMKKFDATAILVCWKIWKHGNAWVFNNSNQQCTPIELVRRIREEMSAWESA